jgi:trigger factor
MHHDEKKRNRLPSEKIIAANNNPYNRRESRTAPYELHYGGDAPPVVSIATVDFYFPGAFCPLMIDGLPILLVYPDETGQALFDATFWDEINWPVLELRANEVTLSVAPWDIEYVGARLTIRSEPRNIFLILNFEVPNRLVVERGRVLYNGVEVVIEQDELRVVTVRGTTPLTVKRSNFQTPIGVQIGYIPPGTPQAPLSLLQVLRVPRYADRSGSTSGPAAAAQA